MRVRIAVSQLNQTVGDYEKNYNNMKNHIEQAYENEADIILFPELSLNGYPPEDLILKTSFLDDSQKYIDKIIQFSKNKNMKIVFGAIDWDVETYNSAFTVFNGQLLDKFRKMFLPNYSVFDEKRYFIRGRKPFMFEMNKIKIGVTVCEDLWVPNGPALAYSKSGANIILNLSASPYSKSKHLSRTQMVKSRASELSSWIVYSNLVGGQDEVVFDGGSLVANPYGEIALQAPLFEEGLFTIDIDPYEATRANLREGKRKHYSESIYEDVESLKIDHVFTKKTRITPVKKEYQDVYEQLYLSIKIGLKDYMHKNGFKKALVGLSGGLDSAIVAAIASEALGSENVLGVLMPSKFTSEESIRDALKLAENLKIKTKKISINNMFNLFLDELKEHFEDKEEDITEENLQARIRGNILMALSNKFGYMVLATSNKSESATGYSTLYGDMVGGFSPIKDLYKTEAYKVARKYNELKGTDVIPENILNKAPSAELKFNQTDQDTLPPYELLDEILFRYIEREMSIDELIESGYDKEMIKKIIKMVDNNEYKRRQSAPGIKLTERNFGKDRRLPLTNGYKIWEKY